MKKIIIPTILITLFFAAGCGLLTNASTASAGNADGGETARTGDSAVPEATPKSLKLPAGKPGPTPSKPAGEPLPRKVDDQTAVSPVYGINSKNCVNHDDDGSEGEDFVRKCKGYGNYSLWASGFDSMVNYRIEADDPKVDFVTYLFPLEGGDADEYRRADRFVQKLTGQLEWVLDDRGKPYAVFVHAVFYKNTGNAKTAASPKNKAAEYILLRGLNGYKEIDSDIQTEGTAYNPDEWARKTAYEVWESRKK